MKFKIEIVRYDDDVVDKTIEGNGGQRAAEKCDRGININLNHREYYTRIVEERKRARPYTATAMT